MSSRMVVHGQLKLCVALGLACTLFGAFYLLYHRNRHSALSLQQSPHPQQPHQCPSLHSPHPQPIDHALQVCSHVPSTSSAFNLRLCHDPALCNAFTLHISPSHSNPCQAVEHANRKLSDDPLLDAWIKREIGPDMFEIRTDGAERVAAHAVYHGNCRWTFDVRLSNAGPVWLSAWHTYQYYHAFDEKNGTWPNALRTPLFTDPVALHICSPFCAPIPPALMDPHRSLLSYPSPTVSYHPVLPPCSDTEPVSGSYLPVHHMELLHPSAPLPQSEQPGTPVAGRYRFVPHACAWTHAGLRFSDHTMCVQDRKKVVVVGDSHGRVVADGLYHRLSGNREIMTASEKQGHKSHQVDQLSIDFWWDPKGEDASCSPGGSPLADADVLIMSIAQHFVWDPTTQYTSTLMRLFHFYSSCPRPASRPPLRLVYLTSPAWPARDDWWVSNFGDQRTNARLRRWREAALQLARESGWRVVDQYELTRPHVWEVLVLDKAHFLGTDALDPILDEVIGKAGICDR